MKTIEQPEEVMYIFDNEGETIDRYTICILYENGDSFTVATSYNPSHPLGVWSLDENGYIDLDELENDEEYNKNIGKQMEWGSLPYEVKEAVLRVI